MSSAKYTVTDDQPQSGATEMTILSQQQSAPAGSNTLNAPPSGGDGQQNSSSVTSATNTAGGEVSGGDGTGTTTKQEAPLPGQQQQDTADSGTNSSEKINPLSQSATTTAKNNSNKQQLQQQQQQQRSIYADYLPPDFVLDSDSDEEGEEDLNPIAACFRWVYDTVYSGMLESHDSFEVVLRKMITTVAFVSTPLFIAVGLFWAVKAGINDEPDEQPALILAGVLSLICIIFIQIFYWHTRLTRTATNNMVSLLILGGMVWVGSISIAVPHFPSGTCLIGLAEASVLTRSDWFVIHMATVTVLYVIATYNITFLNFGDWTLLTVPVPHQGSSSENLAMAIFGWCVLVLMTGALYLQYMEYLRLVHRSSSTTQMGWRIAHHLRHWDIPAVEKTLGKYRLLPHSDNFFHTQFSNIVQTIRDLSVYLPRDIISALVRNGESLRDAELRARNVTLAWIEMANFPALCDSLPCDELAKLLRWFHEAMARAVRQHDGVVVRLAGNMLCGMWNAPQKHENAASRACMAALHAVAIAEDVLVRKFEDEGFGLQVRVGVHSGTAMVGPLGSCDRSSFTANGGAVHFSAAMAKSGKRIPRSSIMVSDGTLRDANADLAVLGRGGARFVSREAAEARAARHTTATTVHHLLGVYCDPVSAGGLLSSIGHDAGPTLNPGARAPRRSGGTTIPRIGGDDAAANDTAGGHGAAHASIFAGGPQGNPALPYPASVLSELHPQRMLEGHFAVDAKSLEMVNKLDRARRLFNQQSFSDSAAAYEALLIACSSDAAWPGPLRRSGVSHHLVESFANTARTLAAKKPTNFDPVVIFPDD